MGWKKEIKVLVEGKFEGISEQEREVKKETEEMQRDLKEQEKRWREERKGLIYTIKRLEKRVKELETGTEKEENRENVGKRGKGKGTAEERMKEIERNLERKERDERRRNVVVREVEVKEGKKEEAVEEVLNNLEQE